MKVIVEILFYITILFFVCLGLIMLSEFWNIFITKNNESYPWGSSEAAWYYQNSETYALVNFSTGALFFFFVSMTILNMRQKKNFQIWYLANFILLILVIAGWL